MTSFFNEDITDKTNEELGVMVETYRESNKNNVQSLAMEGAQLDPAGVLMTRIETLVSALDERTRLVADLYFEKAVYDQLEGAAQQVRQAKLLAPASPQEAKVLNNGRLLTP